MHDEDDSAWICMFCFRLRCTDLQSLPEHDLASVPLRQITYRHSPILLEPKPLIKLLQPLQPDQISRRSSRVDITQSIADEHTAESRALKLGVHADEGEVVGGATTRGVEELVCLLADDLGEEVVDAQAQGEDEIASLEVEADDGGEPPCWDELVLSWRVWYDITVGLRER